MRTKLITFRPAKPKSCSLSDIPDLEGNVAKRKGTDVVSEWAGGALTHPEFGISVITLFLPQGTDYAHPDLKT